MGKKFLVIAILFFSMGVFTTINYAQGAEDVKTQLKILHFAPPVQLIHKDVLVPWTKMLEEHTGGKVAGVIFPGEVLGKAKDFYDMVTAGTVDACFVYLGASPGRFPLHNVYELPLLLSSPRIGSIVAWENFEKEGAMNKEFSDVKVLCLNAIPTVQIHTSSKPIRKLEDMKGMKLRTIPGPVAVNTMKALGAIPVTMAVTDIYVALEKGTIDGTAFPFESMVPFKTIEVTKYHTEVNLWGGIWYFVMNKRKWNGLSLDIQKDMEGITGAWLSEWVGSIFEEVDMKARKDIRDMPDHEVINMSEEEKARWKKLVTPVWDEWVSQVEKKNLPGRKILDSTLDRLEKYSQ